MRIRKHSIRYIVVFLSTLAVLTGMLVLVALIPQSAIKENMAESAKYLCEGELFGNVIEDVEGSRIDRYADSILLGIAYQYDSSNPLSSVMRSSYYQLPYQNENENLREAVTDGKEANQQYLRYWHGSNVIVRPLLLVFDIQQIYVLNGILLAVLVLWLLILLLKNRWYTQAVGIFAGLVMTASWFVPFSLEYTWIYLIMLIVAIVGVKLAMKSGWKHMGILFLICGMVTNYVDFLTAETLTLLVPLLLTVKITIKDEDKVKQTIKAVLAWGCGYAGMWVAKWLLASVVLQENVMPYVSGSIGERLSGNIGIGMVEYLWGAVFGNIKCLFPFEYGTVGMLAGIAVVLLVIYIGYVYHKKQICKGHILLYVCIGVVPYIRYLVLHNHSYLHCFFTYRAQMATILALVLILEELTEWRWFFNGNARRRKS